MNIVAKFEHRASSSQSKHEGESSFALCDRLSRTRDNSQRQLPTDHDYAVPTREYQTDQSSLKSAPAAARSVLEKKQKQRQLQKPPHRFRRVDTVTPYQGLSLIEMRMRRLFPGSGRVVANWEVTPKSSSFRNAGYTLIWLRRLHITRALARVELSRIAQTLVRSESLPKVSGLI
jgi:hypothetical protein